MTTVSKAITILIDMVISPRVGSKFPSADLDRLDTVFIPCFAASCHFTQTTSPLCDRALRGDKGDGALSVSSRRVHRKRRRLDQSAGYQGLIAIRRAKMMAGCWPAIIQRCILLQC
jgi:hypothetical protein